MATAQWRCRCGTVAAEVTLGAGDRLICYCKDCQGFARHLGAEDVLDPLGGSDIFTTLPDRVVLTRGADQLRALQMTPKGPLRWFTACCNTPFANSLTTPALPFASLILNGRVAGAAFGPVRMRANTAGARGAVPAGGMGKVRFVQRLLWRAVIARLSGRHRQTPFFDAEGQPVAAVRRLSKDARRAALP